MTRNLRLGRSIAAVAIVALVAAACSSKATTKTAGSGKKVAKAAFVYIGPPGDGGWTYQHEQGRLELEKALVGRVKTTKVENVPETPSEAERVIRQLAQQGNDVIFTTSFGYMDPTLAVAKEFPKVKFEHCSGYKSAPNMATTSGRWRKLGTCRG